MTSRPHINGSIHLKKFATSIKPWFFSRISFQNVAIKNFNKLNYKIHILYIINILHKRKIEIREKQKGTSTLLKCKEKLVLFYSEWAGRRYVAISSVKGQQSFKKISWNSLNTLKKIQIKANPRKKKIVQISIEWTTILVYKDFKSWNIYYQRFETASLWWWLL